MIKAIERGSLLLIGTPRELSKIRGLLEPHNQGCQVYSAVGVQDGLPSHALFYRGVLNYMYSSTVNDILEMVHGVKGYKVAPEGLKMYGRTAILGLWVESQTLPPSSNFYKIGDSYISQVEDFDNA